MSQERFIAAREQVWETLDLRLRALEAGRPAGQPMQDMPALYRRVCQHLALARARAYSRGLTERLNRLALRAHQQLYAARPSFGSELAGFLLRDYPRLVRAEWRAVLGALLLFLGSALAVALAVGLRPELVYTVMEPVEVAELELMYRPGLARRYGRGEESDTDFAMFGYYLRHNTTIGLQSYAGGIAGGLGTAFYLIYNGLYLGAAAAHLSMGEQREPFWSFAAGHSAPELSAVVLSGAAGLRLGQALLAPGRLTRRRALREAAAVGLRLMGGVALLFLFAAFVEAFWSPLVWPGPPLKYGMGVLLWAVLLAYLLGAGRGRAAR